jgi:heptosyltransferase-1
MDRLLGKEQWVMVCPGSNWENKRLGKETLKEFLIRLSRKYIFIWGNQEERDFIEVLAKEFANSICLGNLTFPAWQYLMRHVAYIISMDSSALHLAATTQTSTFSIFGPSNADIYRPMGDHHISIQGTCPYGMKFIKRCPKLRTCKTGACIKDISPTHLLEKVKDL